MRLHLLQLLGAEAHDVPLEVVVVVVVLVHLVSGGVNVHGCHYGQGGAEVGGGKVASSMHPPDPSEQFNNF